MLLDSRLTVESARAQIIQFPFQVRVTFDFETRAEIDLKKVGAYKYSKHPKTRPTCLSLKSNQMTSPWLLRFDQVYLPWKELPEAFRTQWLYWISSKALFSAHNAFFEFCIYNNIMVARLGWPKIPFELWRCTAAKAARCALPRSLEGAGAALQLSIQKDKLGTNAVMATCKPTKAYNAWKKANQELALGAPQSEKRLKKAAVEPAMFLEPDSEKGRETFEALYYYCKMDTLSEEQVDENLPDLPDSELVVWRRNLIQNWRGIRVDTETCKKVLAIVAEEKETGEAELFDITMGWVQKAGARESVLEFLRTEGVELPDLTAATVRDALKDGKISDDARRVLELRSALTKTSNKKFQSFIDRADEDDSRCRDILLYCGASTGRSAGVGINPYNFPRGLISPEKGNPYSLIEDVRKYDAETLKLWYGEDIAVLFSAILRNIVQATAGLTMYSGDFSKIEVAILWWLADNKPGLQVLKSGKDPYIYQAAANMGMTYEQFDYCLKQELKEYVDGRQLGKAQILGCGFGMGVNGEKFVDAAKKQFGLVLTIEQGSKAVWDYRRANPAVPQMWSNVERAAKDVVMGRAEFVEVNKTKFYMWKKFLVIELVSGQKLYYLNPEITMHQTLYGAQETLSFDAPAKDRKSLWRETTWGGKLTENIVQATARSLMVDATARVEAKGFIPLFDVYDEILCEAEPRVGRLKEFWGLMKESPIWGDSELPLEVGGWEGLRYRK